MIAAHFKNGKTKHPLSEIPWEYKSGKMFQLKKCQWPYGAPGHGKGVWGRPRGNGVHKFQMAYEP